MVKVVFKSEGKDDRVFDGNEGSSVMETALANGIGEILAETDLPRGAFSVLPCHRDGADLFTTDERLKLLSFTGSPDVGWRLKAQAGKKKVVLELGGNAGVVIESDADIEVAAQRCAAGGFGYAGQTCISE